MTSTDAVNKPSVEDSTRALALRAQALGLLEQAAEIDGLKPYVVIHEHAFGTCGYIAWAHQEPDLRLASSVLDSEFEEERGEVLTVHSLDSLGELVGLELSARPEDILSAGEGDATVAAPQKQVSPPSSFEM